MWQELAQRNPSLWRCLQAQQTPLFEPREELIHWQGPKYYHTDPCRAHLPFEAEIVPNLILWNGCMHMSMLQWKPDAIVQIQEAGNVEV